MKTISHSKMTMTQSTPNQPRHGFRTGKSKSWNGQVRAKTPLKKKKKFILWPKKSRTQTASQFEVFFAKNSEIITSKFRSVKLIDIYVMKLT